MPRGTSQRNVSAALVVFAQNIDADVITYLMVIAVIDLVVPMPAAGELGKCIQKELGEKETAESA